MSDEKPPKIRTPLSESREAQRWINEIYYNPYSIEDYEKQLRVLGEAPKFYGDNSIRRYLKSQNEKDS